VKKASASEEKISFGGVFFEKQCWIRNAKAAGSDLFGGSM
jgi:hypothetical protein